MTDRPLIFSASMIRALLDGRKTSHREIIKPQPDPPPGFDGWTGFSALCPERHYEMRGYCEERGPLMRHRPLKFWNGDRLWVREAWRAAPCFDDRKPREITPGNYVHFEADRTRRDLGRYRHARFMPRWASRLTLIVEGVKVERLRDISEDDAETEGCEFEIWDQALAVRNYSRSEGWFCMWGGPECYTKPDVYVDSDEIWRASFRTLWNSLHGSDAWEANPWVAANRFKVIKANIDAMQEAA
ncbi:MAG: hypothetical protein PHR16_16690 [Methylovulum sp.]|nr:hypothetical protein [Methylovulum sp.]